MFPTGDVHESEERTLRVSALLQSRGKGHREMTRNIVVKSSSE